MSLNSRIKAILIMDQRKAFYRHSIGTRIPPSRCAKKEIVDMDILVTTTNGDRKIIKTIRITSRPPSRIRMSNQLSQFRYTYTKVISIE